jgi:hypothetical protein
VAQEVQRLIVISVISFLVVQIIEDHPHIVINSSGREGQIPQSLVLIPGQIG